MFKASLETRKLAIKIVNEETARERVDLINLAQVTAGSRLS
jgi:hypothetical protein